MYRSEFVLNETMIIKANTHQGDISKDKKFDCESNCPYCNDKMVNIKLQYVLPVCDDIDCPSPVYEDIHYAYLYKKYKCQICGKEFWEEWYANVDYYTYSDGSHPEYYDEIGDYTDVFYENRYGPYRKHFEEAIESGFLRIVASYMHTTIVSPVDEKEYESKLSRINKVYKNI